MEFNCKGYRILNKKTRARRPRHLLVEVFGKGGRGLVVGVVEGDLVFVV